MNNDLLEKYRGYTVGQLKLLAKNPKISKEKAEALAQVMAEKEGGAPAPAEDGTKKTPAKKATPAKKSTASKKPTAKKTPAKKPTPAKAPAKKEAQPKEPKERKSRTNAHEPFRYEVDQKVKVMLAKNRKERAGEIIEGTIVGTKIWDGHKEYIIDTELGKMNKRETTLDKHNS
jgi:hypothetical protein